MSPAPEGTCTVSRNVPSGLTVSNIPPPLPPERVLVLSSGGGDMEIQKSCHKMCLPGLQSLIQFPPPPPPPTHTHTHFNSNPSSLPLLPYALDSLLPFPHFIPALAFWTPLVNTLWSAIHSSSTPSPPPTLVLSLTVPPAAPLPPVLRPPDHCRPGTLGPFSMLHPPCPHLTPSLPNRARQP